MAKILLSEEVRRVQNELRRLSTILRGIGKFEIDMAFNGATVKKKLEDWVQGNISLLGSYTVDDVDANLDTNASVIKNLSIAVSNITSLINRVNVVENDKADKTTTEALQADINNLVEALVAQEVWTGDFALPLPANDNIVPWSADITNALNTIPAGRTITLKLQNMAGDPISVFLVESLGDNSFTSESFNGDPEVQVRVTTTQFELNGLRATERGDYKVIEIRSIPSGVTVDLTNLAIKDLSNVNVGSANAGKVAKVKADGTLEYVAEQDITGKADKTYIDNLVKYEKSRVLSFAEQKTTGAFADRTLFSEKEIKDGYAIVGGNDGNETVGEVIKHRHQFGIANPGNQPFNPATGAGTGDKIEPYTTYTGGQANLPAGHKLIKYAYTALKDITNGEMGK